MKELDLKSSLFAGAAGGILLVLIVYMYDKLLGDPSDPVENHISLLMIAFMGAVVGFSVQTAERFTGAS
jgi:hypothetical protein